MRPITAAFFILAWQSSCVRLKSSQRGVVRNRKQTRKQRTTFESEGENKMKYNEMSDKHAAKAEEQHSAVDIAEIRIGNHSQSSHDTPSGLAEATTIPPESQPSEDGQTTGSGEISAGVTNSSASQNSQRTDTDMLSEKAPTSVDVGVAPSSNEQPSIQVARSSAETTEVKSPPAEAVEKKGALRSAELAGLSTEELIRKALSMDIGAHDIDAVLIRLIMEKVMVEEDPKPEELLHTSILSDNGTVEVKLANLGDYLDVRLDDVPEECYDGESKVALVESIRDAIQSSSETTFLQELSLPCTSGAVRNCTSKMLSIRSKRDLHSGSVKFWDHQESTTHTYEAHSSGAGSHNDAVKLCKTTLKTLCSANVRAAARSVLVVAWLILLFLHV